MRCRMTLWSLLGRGLLDGPAAARPLARAVWDAWTRVREEEARREEVKTWLETPSEELKPVLFRVIADLAAGMDPALRQNLTTELVTILRKGRQRREPITQAEDLVPLLPGRKVPLRSSSPGEPRVEVRVADGPRKGEVFPFDHRDTFVVGRSSRAHFPGDGKDRHYSRMHCLIEVNPPQALLVDLGSRNGTFLNGMRLTQPVPLAEGDRIRVGSSILVVTMPGPLAVPPGEDDRPKSKSMTGSRTHDFQPRAREPHEFCRVCQPRDGASDQPICAECRLLIDGQPQPIPGFLLVRTLGQGGIGTV
ncbi:MAG: FHA domain-containing protein, partial [Gemmataceae bacterium]